MRLINRRNFLKQAPSVAAVVAAPPSLLAAEAPTPSIETPQQVIDRLVIELHLAMRQAHGACDLVRSEDSSMIAFCPPPRPRTVEFAGAGRYEVDDRGIRPIMFIERAPQYDHPRDGRCFKAVPEPSQLKTRFYYEGHLRTILVRKIAGALA
jgi:hypothetical protein